MPKKKQNFYFTADGNFGGDEFVVINIAKLDEHFLESVENLTRDSDRMDFAIWFAKYNHKKNVWPNETDCHDCFSFGF